MGGFQNFLKKGGEKRETRGDRSSRRQDDYRVSIQEKENGVWSDGSGPW